MCDKVMYKVIKTFRLCDLISRDDLSKKALLEIIYRGLSFEWEWSDSSSSSDLVDAFNATFDGVNGLEWLEENGYIRKVEPEKFYYVGQTFEYIGIDSNMGYFFEIVGTGDGNILMVCLNGSAKGLAVQYKCVCNNTGRITQSEFDKMCYPCAGNFKEVEIEITKKN